MAAMHGGYLAGMWRVCGAYLARIGGYLRYLADIWRIFGAYVADIRRTCGGHVADMWRTCGGYVAGLWLGRDQVRALVGLYTPSSSSSNAGKPPSGSRGIRFRSHTLSVVSADPVTAVSPSTDVAKMPSECSSKYATSLVACVGCMQRRE